MIAVFLSFVCMISPIQIVPADLTVSYQGELLTTISRTHLAVPFMDGPFINEGKLKLLMEHLEQKVYKRPINATLDEDGNIVEGEIGHTLDQQKFQTLYQKYLYNGQSNQIELPIKAVYPKIDGELLASVREKKVGQFITYYKQGNKERSHNIKLAAQAINNYVLMPDETFSFNQVVGKRTKEKGYKRAPVIVKGELAEGIGGGICQVSSTLFNAVDLKGLEVVERYSHSRIVPYVPPGRDATVSWYGPDFAFKNNLDQPILIQATAGNGKMMIKIYTSNS